MLTEPQISKPKNSKFKKDSLDEPFNHFPSSNDDRSLSVQLEDDTSAYINISNQSPSVQALVVNQRPLINLASNKHLVDQISAKVKVIASKNGKALQHFHQIGVVKSLIQNIEIYLDFDNTLFEKAANMHSGLAGFCEYSKIDRYLCIIFR